MTFIQLNLLDTFFLTYEVITMQRFMCKSKLHRVCVTDANLNYDGSITIDPVLMEAADLMVYEKVQVLNINNGTRAETYVIEGERNSGQICINGALARWAQTGDLIIIISYALVDDKESAQFKPKIVLVDEKNNIRKVL